MPRCNPPRALLLSLLRQMLTAKFLFIVSSFSLLLSVLYIQLSTNEDVLSVNENLIQEALENVAHDFRYAEVYRKISRLPKDLKYILLWTPKDIAPFYFLGEGQRGFIQKNCSVINCYVTDDRKFFGGDTSQFDAIAFNGRNIWGRSRVDLPQVRSPHQKYIFFNMESAENYPVCHESYDGFFNWTATYKLDSDLAFQYIMIRDSNGEVVGPRQNMEWLSNMSEVDEELSIKLLNKSRAAAWFVSNCSNKNGRRDYVNKLKKALEYHGMTVDIYGSCGTMKCSKDRKSDCDAILERDYYFYLSFENSFAEDYVTEKLLTALQHSVVPIVYGGADYSRFLPPGTYLDARKLKPRELALAMVQLIFVTTQYRDCFRWRQHYTYHDPVAVQNVCALCAALNNKTLMETPTVYQNFRSWWHPNFRNRCR